MWRTWGWSASASRTSIVSSPGTLKTYSHPSAARQSTRRCAAVRRGRDGGMQPSLSADPFLAGAPGTRVRSQERVHEDVVVAPVVEERPARRPFEREAALLGDPARRPVAGHD